MDRAELPRVTISTRTDGVVVSRTAERPDFHDGNRLTLVDPPAGARDVMAALNRWQAELGDVAGVEQRIISWETGPAMLPPGVADAVAAAGLVVEPVELLRLDALAPAPTAPGDVALEPVADDAGWEGVVRLSTAEFAGGTEAFARWQAADHRARVEAGTGRWWGARQVTGAAAGEVVGQAGLLAREGHGVVTDVVVANRWRGRGVGTALVHALVAAALADDPGLTVLIGADRGSPAEGIYRRLGFTRVATLWWCAGRVPG